jgi:hypothetical protein
VLNDSGGRGARGVAELTGLAHGPFLLETTAAENRASLSGFEGDRGFSAAFRADSACFRAGRSRTGGAFCLALFTTLRIVLELLVEKEQLFAGSENEIVSAVSALQDLVYEIHPATLAFCPKYPFNRRRTDGAFESPGESDAGLQRYAGQRPARYL